MTDKTDIAAQLSKRILHYADMASCTSEGTSVLGADLLKLIGDTINDLIGKLEAELQRADELRVGLESEISHSNRCIAKINTLEEELAALKAKLANPVVLNSSDVMSRNFVIKAIHAAGFTVKGGEC